MMSRTHYPHNDGLPVLTVAEIADRVGCLRHEAAVGDPCWHLVGDAGPRGGSGVCSERLTAYLHRDTPTLATSVTTKGSRA